MIKQRFRCEEDRKIHAVRILLQCFDDFIRATERNAIRWKEFQSGVLKDKKQVEGTKRNGSLVIGGYEVKCQQVGVTRFPGLPAATILPLLWP
ncbi:hypothetical protein M0802_008819 [Mischocyttarus mexicanus]|nr:hypothetical protein M0802_008819 [Mischocyttarus mexicanus]